MHSHTINFQKIETALHHVFHQKELIVEAFTHSSYSNEFPKEKNNERLEFLGDAILNFVITESLYRLFPEIPEGDLSKRRAVLISRPACAQRMEELALCQYLRLGRGERLQGDRSRESHLANLYEAIIGALYLDGGLSPAYTFIKATVTFDTQQIETASKENWKAELQEYVAKHKRTPLEYVVTNETGPDHAKVFEVTLFMGQQKVSTGSGKTKKLAEQQAAKYALEFFLKK